jgi:hypothetical protein
LTYIDNLVRYRMVDSAMLDMARNQELYQNSSNLSTTTATRRKLTGLRTAASIIHREACSACLKPSFVRREPQLNQPNSNWN